MPHFFPVSKQTFRVSFMRGFALPTILIASVVMLIVLVVSVTSTTTVRTALKAQYYEQLAQVAGEAGIAYAEACLNANNGVPQWTDAAPLKPNTDCSGVELVACPTTSTNALCSVTLNDNVRSSFSIGLPEVEAPSALIVAGGGSGGGSTGGGGGAGGVVFAPDVSVAVGSYPVVVGAGGAVPGNQLPGRNGENSSFNGIVAIGGGGGGYSAGGTSGGPGQPGGSGGGGQTYFGAFPPGSGTSGQGNNGGTLAGVAGSTGGGGAGGAGSNIGTANNGGAGGVGISNSITGTAVFYGGGGGGGGAAIAGAGGNGGGGAGGTTVGSAGAANTGGGGGGGWPYAGGNGGAGGSGVVVISYTTGSLTATGGTITTSGTKTIHRFTSSSTFTVTAVSPLRTLPNTGFVEILRESNSAVWRRYDQKAAPASVVPDLCSGEAKSIYGWSNAVPRSASYTLSGTSAKPIGIANGSINPGTKYFRKDFSVTNPGTYNLTVAGTDSTDWFIDGSFVVNRNSTTPASTAVTLTAGCHSIYAKTTSNGIRPSNSDIIASLTQSGSTQPIVVSDASWRVSAGTSVHYASSNYYADPSSWGTVRDVNSATSASASWATTTGDSSARFISTTHNNTGGNYPATQYSFFRDGRDIEVATNTPVRVGYLCDDSCDIYLNGEQIASGVWSTVHTYETTLTPGKHRFGASVYNINSGQSGFALVVTQISNGTVLARSDPGWTAANFWSGTNDSFTSYANDYLPNPRLSSAANVELLIVAGGGGGGGNCDTCGGAGGGGGGGRVYESAYPVSVGSIPITVGAGGAGGVELPTRTNGSNGANSLFGILTAIGGGGGGAQLGTAGLSGGSGGGGSGGSSPAAGAAGSFAITQGSVGAAGSSTGSVGGGGGGGAGGAGQLGTGTQDGGIGVAYSISGASLFYAGGGGGGDTTTSAPGAGGSSVGGAGANQSTNSGNGFNGTANRGGGGGGASGQPTGGNGGTGGSGVVIISYPTGSMTATGGTITTSGGNTIHRFTTSGTFTVISIP